MTIKYTKWTQNRPNGHKIYKYLPLQVPTKFIQIRVFGLKIYMPSCNPGRKKQNQAQKLFSRKLNGWRIAFHNESGGVIFCCRKPFDPIYNFNLVFEKQSIKTTATNLMPAHTHILSLSLSTTHTLSPTYPRCHLLIHSKSDFSERMSRYAHMLFCIRIKRLERRRKYLHAATATFRWNWDRKLKQIISNST
jgi:hypothetical protein